MSNTLIGIIYYAKTRIQKLLYRWMKDWLNEKSSAIHYIEDKGIKNYTHKNGNSKGDGKAIDPFK